MLNLNIILSVALVVTQVVIVSCNRHSLDDTIDDELNDSWEDQEAARTTTNNDDRTQEIVLDDDSVINKTSQFSCIGKQMGYYSDVERKCRIYYLCLPTEVDNRFAYEKVSYLCPSNEIFDQSKLTCVDSRKSTIKCHQSILFYDRTNQIFRDVVANALKSQQEVTQQQL